MKAIEQHFQVVLFVFDNFQNEIQYLFLSSISFPQFNIFSSDLNLALLEVKGLKKEKILFYSFKSTERGLRPNLQFVGLLHVFDPLVRLSLRVNHQWPATRICHNNRVIKRETERHRRSRNEWDIKFPRSLKGVLKLNENRDLSNHDGDGNEIVTEQKA